jgi:hypothetical protein
LTLILRLSIKGLRRFAVALKCAQMAELVDAQVSGICGSNVVEVRVFFWAPFSLAFCHVLAVTTRRFSSVFGNLISTKSCFAANMAGARPDGLALMARCKTR